LSNSSWVSQGSYLANAKLSKGFRHAAQQIQIFRQFCDVKEAQGTRKGDTVNFDKFSNISTAGGTLVETNTMPRRTHTPYQGTMTVTEYGNAHGFTGKLEALSTFDENDKIQRILKNDASKTMDIAVEEQFAACKVVYVGSTTATQNIVTNATPTTTCAATFDDYHAKNIVDYLIGTMLAPFYDGKFYAGILSVQAARGLHDKLQAIWQYTKYPLNGEIGSYYKTRYQLTNHALSNAMGATSAYGEAYIFGEDTVMEAIAIPEEVRYEEKDFGRDKALAWYSLLGFKIYWAGDPDNRIVKFGSA
jgi:N4-gp56 family major capsid protein